MGTSGHSIRAKLSIAERGLSYSRDRLGRGGWAAVPRLVPAERPVDPRVSALFVIDDHVASQFGVLASEVLEDLHPDGQGALADMILGSASLYVVHQRHIPVCVVRPPRQ
jgi:hypothetical protein